MINYDESGSPLWAVQLTGWLTEWLTGLLSWKQWSHSSTALSGPLSEIVTLCVSLFTGFPGISWNAGAESKYLEVVKRVLGNKLDLLGTTQRALPLCPMGRGSGFCHGRFWLGRGASCHAHWLERVPAWSETSLQFSGKERTPHLGGEAFLCLSCLSRGPWWCSEAEGIMTVGSDLSCHGQGAQCEAQAFWPHAIAGDTQLRPSSRVVHVPPEVHRVILAGWQQTFFYLIVKDFI